MKYSKYKELDNYIPDLEIKELDDIFNPYNEFRTFNENDDVKPEVKINPIDLNVKPEVKISENPVSNDKLKLNHNPQNFNLNKKLSMLEFKKQLLPYATKIAKDLKIDPNVILAQSFLETGGDITKPLFGIKSGKNYKGNSKSFTTHEEFAPGIKTKIIDSFRTYDNLEDAFNDYKNLILSNRYKNAIGKTPIEYYTELKNSGYATASEYVPSLLKVYNQMSKI